MATFVKTREMDKNEIKRAVAGQICNMLQNNIIEENGGESFVGWLEDGDVFFNGGEGYTEEECEEIMEFVYSISDLVDDLSWALDPQNDN